MKREIPPHILAMHKKREERFSAIIERCRETLRSVEEARGVYLLLRQNKVVYVGQSKDVYSRISTHRLDDEKDFDRAVWMPCEKDELNEIEQALIAAFNPELNKVVYLWTSMGEFAFGTRRTPAELQLMRALQHRIKDKKFSKADQQSLIDLGFLDNPTGGINAST